MADNSSVGAILARIQPPKVDADAHAILDRLLATTREVDRCFAEFEFSAAVQALYGFFWNDFCDWYVEVSKTKLQDPATKANCLAIQDLVLRQTLLLLHPFTPFIAEQVPQLLGDERREGVQQQQRLAQHQVLDGEAVRLGGRVLQLGLGNLHIPVAEIIPEKTVERLYRRAELELREAAVDRARRGEQLRENGVVVGVEFRRLQPDGEGAERGIVDPVPAHLPEAAGAPELRAEILARLDAVLLEADVLPLRRDRHDAEA